MNTQKDNFNQEEHLNQEKAFDKEKIWEMQDEIELLREQVASLKQALCQEYKLSNEYLQELIYTRKEVDLMNNKIANILSSNQQSFDENKQLNKRTSRESYSRESITESHSFIEGPPVKINGSARTDALIVRSNLDKSKAQFAEVRYQSAQIRNRSTQIKAQSYIITNQCRDIQVYSYEVMNRSAKPKFPVRGTSVPPETIAQWDFPVLRKPPYMTTIAATLM